MGLETVMGHSSASIHDYILRWVIHVFERTRTYFIFFLQTKKLQKYKFIFIFMNKSFLFLNLMIFFCEFFAIDF